MLFEPQAKWCGCRGRGVGERDSEKPSSGTDAGCICEDRSVFFDERDVIDIWGADKFRFQWFMPGRLVAQTWKTALGGL